MPTHRTEVPTKYDAFISYRRGGRDEMVACTIFRQLNGRRVAKKFRGQTVDTKLRLFLDQDSLHTSSDLDGELAQALRKSRYLIVICTPRTLEKVDGDDNWVLKEVAIFESFGWRDRIIPVLVGDSPEVSFPPSFSRDEDTDRTTLNGPVFAPSSGLSRSRTNRRESLRIAATLIGCEFDELWSWHRARMRLVRLGGAAAAVLVAVLIVALSLVADSEDRAQSKAQALAIARRAGALAAEDPELARLLALEAYELASRSEASLEGELYPTFARVATTLPTGIHDADGGMFVEMSISPDGEHGVATLLDRSLTELAEKNLDRKFFDVPGQVWLWNERPGFGPPDQTLRLVGAPALTTFGPAGEVVIGSALHVYIWPNADLKEEPIQIAPGVGVGARWAARPGSSRLAYVGTDERLYLVDIGARPTSREITVPEELRRLTDEIPPMAISPDGRRLAVQAGNRLWVWLDLEQAAPPVELVDPRDAKHSGCQFSSDGQWVYTLTGEAECTAWSMRSGRIERSFALPERHYSSTVFAIDEDSGLAVTGRTQGRWIQLWHPQPEARPSRAADAGWSFRRRRRSEQRRSALPPPIVLERMEIPGILMAIAVADGGTRLTMSKAETLHVVDTSFRGMQFPIFTLPTSLLLGLDTKDSEVRDLAMDYGIDDLSVSADSLVAGADRMAKSDAALIVHIDLDAAARGWRKREWSQGNLGRSILRFNLGNHQCRVDHSPDGRLVAFASQHGLRLVPAGDLGGEALDLDQAEQVADVQFLVNASDGAYRWLTAGSEGVQLWSLSARDETASIAFGPCGEATHVVGSDDGQRIVAVERDGDLLSWTADNPQQPTRVALSGERVRALAISPDGTRLVCATAADSILCWDLAADPKGRGVRTHKLSGGGIVRDLVFTPHGKRFALAIGKRNLSGFGSSITEDLTRNMSETVSGRVALRDWSAPDVDALIVFRDPRGVHAIDCSPDGSMLFIATGSHKILAVPTSTAAMVDSMRDDVNRELSREERERYLQGSR